MQFIIIGIDTETIRRAKTRLTVIRMNSQLEQIKDAILQLAKHYTEKEWAKIVQTTPGYVGKWEPTPFNLDRVEAGELPAEYIGKRNLLSYEPGHGTVLLTEGVHFTIGG